MNVLAKPCTGAGQYAFTGSVQTDGDTITGECPECCTRREVDVNGLVLPHQLPPGFFPPGFPRFPGRREKK